ncbi:AMP-binding enzyme [Actinacidiphila guanduensis]|uniref:AMP-binding enzyme n=1 Tax=Actinacidiphila guanduensis TaxID=310781 RepID=A0A1H0F7N8_9ACTN|nr:AMP-binding enzyme [Actinacidiphila guanduensis]
MSDAVLPWPAPLGAHPVQGVRPVPPASAGADPVTRGGGRHSRPRRGRGGGSRLGARDSARLPGPMLRLRAERRPQGVPALPYGGPAASGTAGCSYAELDRRARAVAARLGSLLQPGSRVLLVYPEGPDLAGAFLGCLYAGMSAIPLVQSAPVAPAAVGWAVRRCDPALVLTGGQGWTPLAVDRTRTDVVEADGIRVSGEPVWRLAQQWQPVGVLRGAPAYQRYHDDGAAGGRLEPAMSHSDLSDVMDELAQAVRLGTDEENVGWIAAVHGVEDAVWRILLPIRISG